MSDTNSEWIDDQGPVARLAQGVSINLPIRFISRGLALLVQALLARLLGPEGFGRYAIAWNILRLYEVLGPFGMDKAVIRLASEEDSNRRRVFTVAVIGTLGLGLLIGLGFWSLSPFLAAQVFHDPGLMPVFRWFAPGLGLAAGSYVAGAATRTSQRMQYSAIGQDLAPPAINLALLGLVYVLGVGLIGYVLAGVLSYLLSLLLTLAFLFRLYPGPGAGASVTRRSVLGMFGVASPIWVASLASVLINRLDRIVLPIFHPAEVVGVYQASLQFSTLFPIILSVFNLAYTPILAAGIRRRSADEINALYRASTKWGIYLSLPAFVVLLVVPGPLLETVYGSSFAGGGRLLQVLMVGQVINVFTGASWLTLVMAGRVQSLVRISWTALLAALLIDFALIPRLGALGAAIGASTALGLLHVGALLHVRSNLGLWPYDRTLAKGLFSAIIAGIGLALLTRWLVISPLQTLLLSIGFVGLAYFGALLAQGIDEEDRSFLRRVAQGIRR